MIFCSWVMRGLQSRRRGGSRSQLGVRTAPRPPPPFQKPTTNVRLSSSYYTWSEASLGADGGRFAFRPWRYRFTPQGSGTYRIMAKAANRVGQTQVETLIFNPAGYHNNVIRPMTITVT